MNFHSIKKGLPFENGQEFNDFDHPYAYDLDLEIIHYSKI
jgi:hypothetical protein